MISDDRSKEVVIEKVLIIPDAHITDVLPKDYLPVRRFIAKFKPDRIILLGDFMDIASLSAWDKDKKLLMEGRRYKAEVELANKELDYMQKYCSNIVYLEGNHEWRVPRYIEKNPELEGLIEIPDMLKLKERGTKWVKMNDLFKLGNMYFTHGMYTTTHHAKKHLQTLGCNICYGHTHNFQASMQNMKMQKPFVAYGLGTLGDKNPDYMQNKPGNWLNQFAIMYLNKKNGNFNLYPVNVIGGKFIWDGKEWT